MCRWYTFFIYSSKCSHIWWAYVLFSVRDEATVKTFYHKNPFITESFEFIVETKAKIVWNIKSKKIEIFIHETTTLNNTYFILRCAVECKAKSDENGIKLVPESFIYKKKKTTHMLHNGWTLESRKKELCYFFHTTQINNYVTIFYAK